MTERPAPGFTPIHPNPYIVGNPVRGRAMFFGREAEFEMVRKRFQDLHVGGLMVFCGERRSGKTSILFQILDGRLGSDFIPVLIDMQSMAVGNEIEFLMRISEEVKTALGPGAESIRLPVFGSDSTHSATFQRFIRDVLRSFPTKKLILLFDEYELFENKIDSGLLSPDVLNILANLIENHPVFMVFTGSQHLEQRRREYWRLLGRSYHKMISFLEREDALKLIRQPVEGRVRYDEGVVDAIWRLAAGQPFYTQALCQSLVDHLNERRTDHATLETLSAVVDGTVNNPLPQMIFLWDGLERDEKLVLALLAERLANAEAHAGSAEVLRLLRRRQYPLELDEPRVASTLEKLFKQEMLSRQDSGNERKYAFRMDLWRLWIRRQHSVWQVMREVGLDIRPRKSRLRRAIAILVAGVPVVGVVLVLSARQRNDSGTAPAGVDAATFALVVSPSTAMISLNGRTVGVGRFQQEMVAGEHSFHISAEGFVDSLLTAKLPRGGSRTWNITLRERTGDLRVETRPPGAQVMIDGKVFGSSPIVVRGLASGRPHEVIAVLAGFAAAQRSLGVTQDTLTSISLRLERETATLMVVTDPAGSAIRVDNEAQGKSPLPLTVPLGSHTFTATRAGYLRAETTLAVGKQTAALQIALIPEPHGTLVVQGDSPVNIEIDGVLAVAGVQYSRKALPPGKHAVRVVFQDGKSVEKSVTIHSGERTTYDYSAGSVTSAPGANP